MKIPFIIASIGLIAALFFSIITFPFIQQPLNLSVDPDKYGELAFNIYSGNGFKYPGSSREAIDKAPVYPYLLATVYKIFGGINLKAIQFIQAVFHSLTTLLIFFLVSKVINYKVAIITQFIVALHPILIWYTARIWIESVYVFLFTITCIFYIKLYENITYKNVIITGILNGITILTKSTILFLPVVLMMPFYFKKGIKGFFALMIVALISFLVISPWLWRNYRLSDSHIFVHATLGQNIVLGNTLAKNWVKQPLSNLESWSEGNETIKSILNANNISFEDPMAEKILINYNIEKFINNPVFLISRVAINFLTFWYLSESPLKSLFFLLFQMPLFLIFIMSINKLINSYKFSWIIIITILYYSILHAFIIGWGRYSVPLIPILMVVVVMRFERILSKFVLVDRYLKEKI